MKNLPLKADNKRLFLKIQLSKESKAVSEESMSILAEFEKLMGEKLTRKRIKK